VAVSRVPTAVLEVVPDRGATRIRFAKQLLSVN